MSLRLAYVVANFYFLDSFAMLEWFSKYFHCLAFISNRQLIACLRSWFIGPSENVSYNVPSWWIFVNVSTLPGLNEQQNFVFSLFLILKTVSHLKLLTMMRSAVWH